MFGAANQLVAALALIVVTAYLVKRGRPTRYTLIPAVFMLLTTCGALIWKAGVSLKADPPDLTLGIAAIVLLGLAIYVGISGLGVIRRRTRRVD
jgi:carbon starvation protein